MQTAIHPPQPDIQLRDVGESDKDFLFAVYASTRAEELAPLNWSAAQKEVFLRQQFGAQTVSYTTHYPGAVFQIIVVEGQDAGRLYVHRRDQDIRIMDIALLDAFRGRGVGSQLIGSLLKEGEMSRRKVSIHVEIFNPAIRLYERLGFRLVATEGLYHLMEWTPEAAALPPEGRQLLKETAQ